MFIFSEKCYQSKMLVIKAIRLHYNNILPWILNTNIKVIQLIRDPRGIFFSQFKAKNTFKEWVSDIDGLCKMMLDDAQLEELLPSDR